MTRFLFGLFTLLVFAVGAIVLLLENPDRFKPQITAAAQAATGYQLKIEGELSWRYWPPIAINVSDIQLGAPGAATFASFQAMSIDVDLIPLLTQQTAIDINEIVLVGGTIDLTIDTDGNKNWEADQSDPVPEGASADNQRRFSTTVHQFAVDDLRLSYVDQQSGTDVAVSIDNLVTSTLAKDKPFDIASTFTLNDRREGIEALVSTTGQLLLKSDTGNINFNDLITTADVTVEGHRYPQISLSSTGEWRAEDQELILNRNGIQISAINLATRGVVFLGTSEPRFSGAVELDIANPSQVEQDLDVSLPVQFLQIKTDISASPSHLELITMEGQFDDSTMTGTAMIANNRPINIKAELRVDQLNTARYLKTDAPVTSSSGNRQDVQDAELFPFEAIRRRTMDVILRIDRLEHEEQRYTATKSTIRNTQRTLETMTNTNAFGGKLVLQTNSELEEDGETRVRVSLDKLDASQIVDYAGFTGKLSGNADLSFYGSYLSDLSSTLSGKSNFNIADGTLDVRPVKKLARMIETVRGKPSAVSQWPDIMPFKRMIGQHHFNGGTVSGQVFTAEFENLQLAAVGGFDLVAQTLNYDVSAMFKAPQQGQFNVDEELVGVRWPMTCEGHFGDAPADLCFGQEGAISDLVAELVKQELKRRGNRKLQEALDEKIPEEYRQLTDELFKNLFK